MDGKPTKRDELMAELANVASGMSVEELATFVDRGEVIISRPSALKFAGRTWEWNAGRFRHGEWSLDVGVDGHSAIDVSCGGINHMIWEGYRSPEAERAVQRWMDAGDNGMEELRSALADAIAAIEVRPVPSFRCHGQERLRAQWGPSSEGMQLESVMITRPNGSEDEAC